MRRLVVIGDVHGCIDEFVELLNTIKADKDRIVFLGDLIDKGPDSLAVIDLAYSISKNNEVLVILGNHEVKFLRYVKYLETDSVLAERMSGVGSYKSLYNRLTSDHLTFLRNGFLIKKNNDCNMTFVHAGVCSNILLPASVDVAYVDASKKDNHHLLTMTRNVDGSGSFLSLGATGSHMRYWAEVYDGVIGTIVFGHQPFQEVTRFPHAIGLDTGCVFGNKLSAMIVENRMEYFVEVKAKRTYAQPQA